MERQQASVASTIKQDILSQVERLIADSSKNNAQAIENLSSSIEAVRREV